MAHFSSRLISERYDNERISKHVYHFFIHTNLPEDIEKLTIPELRIVRPILVESSQIAWECKGTYSAIEKLNKLSSADNIIISPSDMGDTNPYEYFKSVYAIAQKRFDKDGQETLKDLLMKNASPWFTCICISGQLHGRGSSLFLYVVPLAHTFGQPPEFSKGEKVRRIILLVNQSDAYEKTQHLSRLDAPRFHPSNPACLEVLDWVFPYAGSYWDSKVYMEM